METAKAPFLLGCVFSTLNLNYHEQNENSIHRPVMYGRWNPTTLTTNLMYDDDVKIVQKDGTKGSRVQFKEILGVGVQFNF